MLEYISLGQFNKYYFFIFGSIAVKFIITFISGFSPCLTPNNSIYLFGFKPFFFSHPLFTYCIQYFSMILGGIILNLIYKHLNKPSNDDIVKKQEEQQIKPFEFFVSDGIGVGIIEQISQKREKEEKEINDKKYYKRIILIFSIYFFSQIANTSLNNLGFNRVKLWPFESIFIFFFAKKILHKIMYNHQKVSMIAMVSFCTTVYIINSFIPHDNKDCSLLSGDEKKECQILNDTIYNDISNKLGWYFIPIIMILFMLSMLGNAFSTVSTKWLMDIKYITIPRIIIYIGIVGFIFSLIVLFIFSYIPCDKENELISYICQFENEGEYFYDSYKIFNQVSIDSKFFIEIFLIFPVFILVSFLNILFELLIIIHLDPLYLIPIDCVLYLILEIIDYCLTYSITNKYRDAKFACQIISNGMSDILCGIYLEIIELHFCGLDKFLRRYIIKREIEDKNKILLKDIYEESDEVTEQEQ